MDIEALDHYAVSMLEPPALDRLTEMASRARGGILEIGSYTGGSTIALELGNTGHAAHAVIECGGSHEHPSRASADIIADWKRNMETFGIADNVKLCHGWSYDNAIREEAVKHTGLVGLLFIDADGELAPAFQSFAPYLAPDCLLALDDYWSPEAVEKATRVKPFVDHHVARGRLIPEDVVSGTWFGRLGGQEAIDYFSKTPGLRHEQGHAYFVAAPVGRPDMLKSPGASRLRVFENGVALGPAHSSHQDIRERGAGRFSHWGEGATVWLYMSSSDNTDPRFNDRTYTFTINGEPAIL